MARNINLLKDILGFGEGNARTNRAKKNIVGSLVIKGLNIAIGLVLVRLTINYLEPTKYGIWITLSSVIGWFGFFDIGLGNGLRNKFAESIATGKHELARVYVSTTYAILTMIVIGVLIVFFVVNPFLNWNSILNAGQDVAFQRELSVLALVVFTFFCIRFVLKLLTIIITADQRPALASSFDLLGQIISLVLIYILIKTTEGSLLYLGIIITGAPILVLLLSSAWFFNGKYKAYRPSYRTVDLSKAKDLLNLGIKFFIIQIAAILLYATNNMIITQLFGPEQVTPYNVVFKYFSVLTMGLSIIIFPFWSAFTEAWVKKEIDWIKNIMRKLFLLWFILAFVEMVMLIFSNWAYDIWIGDKVIIPFTMSLMVGVWVLINAWNSIFSQFLNGVGKIKLQLYIGISGALLNVPLAIFLGHQLGIDGVLLANVIVGVVGACIYPFQYKKLINNNAKGIWNA
ncbi:MAG: polysaccharide biosynthesis C-terminal domain-containing protein [Bacteroidales bacterium]|nr:polysaccharide biosynthesis C-terminal domain-containing protein [Bacteroidales bacterium]